MGSGTFSAWPVAALMLLGSCTSAREAPGPAGAHSPGSTQHALEEDFEFEPFPGSRWYGPDGSEVPEESRVVNAITGPDHCEWQSSVMLHLGWPPGHAASDSSESRQYLRDPDGNFSRQSLMTTFDADVALPRDAAYSGYRTDFMELWLDPNHQRAAYLVFADHTERWPRAKETIACG